jgi:DNA-directed RNA polymerase subunit RPC12/RpoP
MPVEFRCTNCRRRLRVPSRWAGNAIDCPRCAAKIVVPQHDGVSGGGLFESRSFERSLRDLEPGALAGVTPERGTPPELLDSGSWNVDPLASIEEVEVPLPAASPAPTPSRRRRRGRTLGVYAVLGVAAAASGAVILAFWLFTR